MKATITLDLDAVAYEIEIMPEDNPIKGAFASGNEAWDRQTEAEIQRRLDSGVREAWCCLRVTAKIHNFQGVDYLGGVSADSEEEARAQADEHGMRAEAFADLLSKLEAAGAVIT